MCTNEIYVGDIGTQFRFTIKEESVAVDLQDLSPTTKTLKFKKPDGTTVEKTASFYTDGSDGIITYTSESGFLDIAGTWRVQGFLDFGATEFNTDIQKFKVHRNLE